jgi:hypothetical protein
MECRPKLMMMMMMMMMMVAAMGHEYIRELSAGGNLW